MKNQRPALLLNSSSRISRRVETCILPASTCPSCTASPESQEGLKLYPPTAQYCFSPVVGEVVAARISRRVETFSFMLKFTFQIEPWPESQEGLKPIFISPQPLFKHSIHPRISRRVETIFEGMSGWELLWSFMSYISTSISLRYVEWQRLTP